MLNRLERVGETLRATLNALAVLAPAWLQQQVSPERFECYGSRVENYDLPKTEAARQKLALVIGEDGLRLLQAIDRATDRPWLAQVPAMITLRRVWSEQYLEEQGQLRWREVKELPATADQLTSPDDTGARYSTKRHLEWIGYKVHFTETGDANTPHLMVHVETTPASTPDDQMAVVVHASLKPRHLLSSEHLVDKGYTDSHILVESQRHSGVTSVGPVADDPGWQAREGTGFDTSQFVVDWERQVVTCPAGKQSISWLPHTYPASEMVSEAPCARQDCRPCAFRARCARAKVEPRMVGLQVREPYKALQAARQRQITEAFQQEYAARLAIESTHEQAIRRYGLRQSRYLGLAKPICSMSSPPPRSISCRWRRGWREHLWPIRAAHHLRPSRRRRLRRALNANSPHPPHSPASLLVRLNQRVQPCTACATLCPPQGSRPIAAAELPLAVYSCTAA